MIKESYITSYSIFITNLFNKTTLELMPQTSIVVYTYCVFSKSYCFVKKMFWTKIISRIKSKPKKIL